MIFKKIERSKIQKILKVDTDSKNKVYHKRIAKLCHYEEGEIVIREGDFDSWTFWVVKGTFEVLQDGLVIADFTKPGEIFGEMSVFEGIPRTATVVAKTDGVCLCIDMSIIENINDKKIEKTIKDGFYSIILERVNRSKKKIESDKKRLKLKYADLVEFESKIKNSERKIH